MATICLPSMMPQESKAQVKLHYPLTNVEWHRTIAELKPAEIVLLYHLRTLNPFGDRFLCIGVRALATDLQMNPSTISRGLHQLHDLGYIDLEMHAIYATVRTRGALFDRKLSHDSGPENNIVPITQDPVNQEADQTKGPPIADNTCCFPATPVVSQQHLLFPDNTCPPELASSIASTAPKTNKTIQTDQNLKGERDQGPVIDQEENASSEIEGPSPQVQGPQMEVKPLSINAIAPQESLAPVSTPTIPPVQVKKTTNWDNFSAPGADPEFFEFVVRKTEKFPDPPVDVRCVAESWIRKQGHVLYPQYVAWKRAMEREAPQVLDTPPPPEEIAEPTNEERLAKYQSMWQAIPCRNTVRRTIAAHPEWGITIGQSGPEMAERSAE